MESVEHGAVPFLLHRGQAILAFSDGEPKKIEHTVLLLTRIGGVIKLGQFETPENYTQALIDDLKRRGLKVQRAIVESLSSGQIRVLQSFPQ